MKTRGHGQGSLWDEKRAGGRKVWVGSVRVAGNQRQRVLGDVRKNGSSDGLTNGMAERALSAFRAEIEAEAAATPKRSDTIAEVGERHCSNLETLGTVRELTIKEYRAILAKHLAPFFSDQSVQEIAVSDVEQFLAHQVKKRGLAAGTVSNQANLLHAILKTAMREGLISSNPVAAAQKPRQAKTEKDLKYLTVEEVEAILRNVTDDDRGETDRVAFLVAAQTGLRRGELLALRWVDIDWTGAAIRVRRSYRRGKTTDPKSERSKRSVPMPDRVATELERHYQRSRYCQDNDLVFCHPHAGGAYDPDTLTDRFKEARDRAGVSSLPLHSLRHTFGTTLATAGVPLSTIQALMGHAHQSTTEIYAAYAPSAERDRRMIEEAFATAGDLAVEGALTTA